MVYSCEVTVCSKHGNAIGVGLFLGEGLITDLYSVLKLNLLEGDAERSIFARVLLMKLMTTSEEISLPSPLGDKVYFHQLEVNIYKFYTTCKCCINVCRIKLHAMLQAL